MSSLDVPRPDAPRGGNTIIPPGKGTSRVKSSGKSGPHQLVRWCFTLKWDETRGPAQLAQMLGGFCKEYYFQKEKGSLKDEAGDGYLHYQGCVATSRPMTFDQVKNLLFNDAHIEACKDWFASKRYCSKLETREEGPWDHKSMFLNPKYQLQTASLYAWQKEVLSWLKEEPDDRHITWIYDTIGGAGKSKLVLYAVDNLNATRFNTGNASDIAFAYKTETIVCFDFQRAKEHVNYSTMEDLKNGHLFSGKYESVAKRFNPPHVIVFANWLPEFKSMSLDRWIVYKIIDKKLVREYEFKIDGEEYKLKKLGVFGQVIQ